jgi:hypothetical protein
VNLAPARPKSMAMRLSIAMVYLVCISAVAGWSLREGAAAQRFTPPANPATPDRDTAIEPAKPSATTGKTRAGGDCSGCGIVESVRRIDTYTEIMEGCLASERAGSSSRPGYGLDDNRWRGFEPLADIVATAAVGKPGKKRFAVTTRHQIVVRFRNGSRQVLNESTPRALHEGERVIVIAGLGRTNS